MSWFDFLLNVHEFNQLKKAGVFEQSYTCEICGCEELRAEDKKCILCEAPIKTFEEEDRHETIER